MNKLKFRNFFAIATLLGGAALITPITLLTTSCSTKKWSFSSIKQVDDYLNKNKVNVSSEHTFQSKSSYESGGDKDKLESDYEFIKKNINLQFFTNMFLGKMTKDFEDSPFSDGGGLDLKKINNDFMELTYISHQGSTYFFDSLEISYIQKHLIISEKKSVLKKTLIDFDFTKELACDEETQTPHYVIFESSGFLGNSLEFTDDEQNITAPLKGWPLSLFDWQNKKLTIEEK